MDLIFTNTFHLVHERLEISSIYVSDEWLRECLEFLKSEVSQELTTETLVNLVVEQWMSSDLREIGGWAFPGNTNWAGSVLDGIYNVQILSVNDVGSSAYSQYRKATGTLSDNAAVSAEFDHNQPWEPRPSRMLMLTLTDGTTEFQGMEWKPIPALTVATVPGTKLRLTGQIECRKKVLLLSSGNVEIIGGSSENLVAENNYVKVLANILNIEHEAIPENNQGSGNDPSNAVSDDELLDLIAADNE